MSCCGGGKSKQKSDSSVPQISEERASYYAKARKKGSELKCCFLGDSGVGKTSIVHRYISDTFEPQDSSIGASFFSKVHTTPDGQQTKINIWDTAGQERFHALSPIYIRGSAIVIVVYDITNKKSLDGAKDWIVRSKDLFESDCVIAFVGSKSDMDNARVIPKADVERFTKEHDYVFIECSSKTGENVHELFDEAVTKAVRILSTRNSFVAQ